MDGWRCASGADTLLAIVPFRFVGLRTLTVARVRSYVGAAGTGAGGGAGDGSAGFDGGGLGLGELGHDSSFFLVRG